MITTSLLIDVESQTVLDESVYKGGRSPPEPWLHELWVARQRKDALRTVLSEKKLEFAGFKVPPDHDPVFNWCRLRAEQSRAAAALRALERQRQAALLRQGKRDCETQTPVVTKMVFDGPEGDNRGQPYLYSYDLMVYEKDLGGPTGRRSEVVRAWGCERDPRAGHPVRGAAFRLPSQPTVFHRGGELETDRNTMPYLIDVTVSGMDIIKARALSAGKELEQSQPRWLTWPALDYMLASEHAGRRGKLIGDLLLLPPATERFVWVLKHLFDKTEDAYAFNARAVIAAMRTVRDAKSVVDVIVEHWGHPTLGPPPVDWRQEERRKRRGGPVVEKQAAKGTQVSEIELDETPPTSVFRMKDLGRRFAACRDLAATSTEERAAMRRSLAVYRREAGVLGALDAVRLVDVLEGQTVVPPPEEWPLHERRRAFMAHVLFDKVFFADALMARVVEEGAPPERSAVQTARRASTSALEGVPRTMVRVVGVDPQCSKTVLGPEMEPFIHTRWAHYTRYGEVFSDNSGSSRGVCLEDGEIDVLVKTPEGVRVVTLTGAISATATSLLHAVEFSRRTGVATIIDSRGRDVRVELDRAGKEGKEPFDGTTTFIGVGRDQRARARAGPPAARRL